MPKILAQELKVFTISWQTAKNFRNSNSYASIASSIAVAFFIVLCSSYSLSAIYYYLLSKY